MLLVVVNGTGVTDSNYYYGTYGDDTIITVLTLGFEYVYGGPGDDYIEANGWGYVYAGSGNDTVLGQNGSANDFRNYLWRERRR